MSKIKSKYWFTVILVLFAACGFGDQTSEANKLVDEANALIEKNNGLSAKSTTLFDELLGENITKVSDFEAYQNENKSKFDELIKINEEREKLGLDIVAKFEEAAKLKVGEKYKAYLDAKILELKKQGENQRLINPLAKSFLATTDADKLSELIEEFNKTSTELAQEAEGLTKKADQIEKDNPDQIKKQ